MVAFRGFMVRFLPFPIGHASSATMQGLHGATVRYGWGGGDRVSSSRGAKLHFGAVVVFVCFICSCIFGARFLSSGWVVFFVCCKKNTSYLWLAFFQLIFGHLYFFNGFFLGWYFKLLIQ